MQDGKEN